MTTLKELIKDIKAEKQNGTSGTIQIYFRPCDRELFAINEAQPCNRDRGATVIYSAPCRVAAETIASAAIERARDIVGMIDDAYADAVK